MTGVEPAIESEPSFVIAAKAGTQAWFPSADLTVTRGEVGCCRRLRIIQQCNSHQKIHLGNDPAMTYNAQ
jgi:hypothetical protein